MEAKNAYLWQFDVEGHGTSYWVVTKKKKIEQAISKARTFVRTHRKMFSHDAEIKSVKSHGFIDT